MSETEQKEKKRKKRQNLENEKIESELLPELVNALSELEQQHRHVDIQVCPKCKSPRVHRVKSLNGDISAHMGITPPKYECEECGWREHTVLKATNKPTSIKDVAIMAEAKEAEHQKRN